MATKNPKLARNIEIANPNIDTTEIALWSYLKVTLKCDSCKIDFEGKVRNHSDKPGVFCRECRRGSSGLELVISSRLEALGIEFIQQSRPIAYVDSTGRSRRFEIDFILPNHSVGFEIQDFSTHSKIVTMNLLTVVGDPMILPFSKKVQRITNLKEN